MRKFERGILWVLGVYIALLLGTCRPAKAQQPIGADTTPRYQANKTTSLSSAAESVTVQQVAPTSAHKNVIFEAAWVYCSVACTFTISQNGTAATATALSIAALNQSPPSSVAAYSGSNVGTGAYVSNAYQVSAGATYLISFNEGQMYLPQNGGTGQNLTITTNSITGTAQITIQWVEK